MLVDIKCPVCKNTTQLDLDQDLYVKYKLGNKPVQKIFPNLNSFEREALISGYCFECTSRIFNTPKPGEDWGKVIGECPICGTDAYERNCVDGQYKCPGCGVKSLVEDIVTEEGGYDDN